MSNDRSLHLAAEPEAVYQIKLKFVGDPVNTWRDASKFAHDLIPEDHRRVLYRMTFAAPAQPEAQELPAPRLGDEDGSHARSTSAIWGAIVALARWSNDFTEDGCVAVESAIQAYGDDRARAAIAQERERQDKIIDAAQAVVEAWDTPIWKKGGPTTAVFINRLRAALKAENEGGAKT